MTPEQLRAFDVVRDRITTTGYAPTVRELGDALGLASTAGAARVIGKLVDAGVPRRSPNKARGLDLLGAPDLRLASLDAIKAELARRGETIGAFDRPVQRAYGKRPSCRVDTCGIAVGIGHVMCRDHWFAVPGDLRDALLAAHSRARRTRSQADAGEYQELLTRAADAAETGRRA